MRQRNTLIATSRSTRKRKSDNKIMRITSIRNYKGGIGKLETLAGMSVITAVEVVAV